MKLRRSSLGAMPGSLAIKELNILIEKNKAPEVLFSCNSRFHMFWQLLMAGTALATAFIVPFEATFGHFGEDDEGIAEYLLWTAVCTDVIFLLDAVKSVNTSYLAETGEEIKNRRLIITHYMRCHFWVDIIPALPWILISVLNPGTAVPLLLVSMSRVIRIYPRTPLGEVSKFLQIFRLGVFLTLLAHCCACIWYAIVQPTESWHPSSDVLLDTNVYSARLINQYFVFLYYTCIILIQGGELFVVSNFDTFIVTMFEILGVLAFTLMFSKVYTIVQDATSAGGTLRLRLEAVESASLELGLPAQLHRLVVDAVQHQADAFQLEWFVFMRTLPDSLFKEITSSLIAPISRQSALQVMFDPRLEDKFLRLIKPQVCLPEEVLFREFEQGDCLYFVCTGSLVASSVLMNETLFEFREGMMCGVSAALSGSHCVTYTATATRSSLLFCLTSLNLKALSQSVPRLKLYLRQEMLQENSFWLNKCSDMLKKLPYFLECSAYDILELALATRGQRFDAGFNIVQKGQNLPYIIMVHSGQLGITVQAHKQQCTIETLPSGSIYGVFSVASASNIQSLNIQTLEPSICMLLAQESICALASDLPALGEYTANLANTKRDDYLRSVTSTRKDTWRKVRQVVIRLLRGKYSPEKLAAIKLGANVIHVMTEGTVRIRRKVWTQLQDIAAVQEELREKLKMVRMLHSNMDEISRSKSKDKGEKPDDV